MNIIKLDIIVIGIHIDIGIHCIYTYILTSRCTALLALSDYRVLIISEFLKGTF